ncbi:MAG TPA: DUF3775 domain-containing protein [Beijerinckia sp.]|jgi:hypothetical protein|nr:DUF3775 domain-containing protein [Beijerinckia sp.]
MLAELNPEKVCFIIVKAREYDVQAEEATGSSSNASDDGFVSVYIDRKDSSVRKELEEFIEAMNEDEQRELIALCLVGGGDYSKEEWSEAMRVAESRPEPSTAAFLLGIPTVSDQLEEGLSMFGFSCQDFEEDRL